MIVKLDLDPKLVWKLEDEAEATATTTDQIIEGILTARYALDPVMPQPVTLLSTRDAVEHLHAAGFTDDEIAARVERVVGHVARVRRGLGLKPNKLREAA